jgi:two-component system, OmpR family, sensor histidine kinase QseC
MRPLTPRSLQGRLLLLLLSSVMVVWAVVAVLTWRDASHELDELLDGHLAQAAALLLVQPARPGEPDDDDGDEAPEAPLLHRYAPRAMFQVWRDGRLVARSANAPVQPLLGQTQGFGERRIGPTDWRVFAAESPERGVQVYVAEQADSRNDILRAVLRSVGVPLALALPLLALGVWAAVRRGTAPLRQLSRQLAARTPQDLQPVQLPDTPTEMAPLLAELNRLFERMQALLESERRFTADAAHELRTPLAALRMQAQVALGADDDAPARRRALQATLQGCDRATHLVEQLLTLARLEAQSLAAGDEPGPAPADAASPGPAAGAPATVDLAAVARRVAAQAAHEALARRQDLALEADAPVPLAVDDTLLGVLVRNLVDNALRYSPPGAQIQITVGAAAGRACLAVEDSGPGLSEAEIARLGERFYRVLRASAAGEDGASGSGLGWSIVRRIAQAQGAQVVVARSSALGGLAVRVSWPRAAAMR